MSQSLRARTISTNQDFTPQSSTPSSTDDHHQEPETPKAPSKSPPSFTQRAISQTLTTTAHLANLLPTGTLLAFQLLIPIFTNNGACDSATRTMTFFLLSLLAISCFLASFTDSVTSSDGKQVYHGFATFNGIFLFDCPDPASLLVSKDLSRFKIKFVDGVHAVLSVLVFVSVALRDKNVLSCFYPMPQHQTEEVLDIVPIGIGIICSSLFAVFPTTRQGIGYPVTSAY